MELTRRRLTELFSGIRFSEEEETVPLFFHRPNLFSNQVACFASDNPVEEVMHIRNRIVLEIEPGQSTQYADHSNRSSPTPHTY